MGIRTGEANPVGIVSRSLNRVSQSDRSMPSNGSETATEVSHSTFLSRRKLLDQEREFSNQNVWLPSVSGIAVVSREVFTAYIYKEGTR
jgi:hypothetical protein